MLESAGIDFKKFKQRGIEPELFAEYLYTSGLALNENLTWITFHGIYDFAYIIKLLTNMKLPESEESFLEDLNMYFKNFYDIRSMVSELSWLKGSLNKLASYMEVKRVGSTHQAGSDSLVTSKVFFRVLEQFGEQIDLEGERNNVHGLVDDYNNEYKPVQTNNNNNTYEHPQTKSSNNNGFAPKMMAMPGYAPNYHPMTTHNPVIYSQNVNNFYKPNINVNTAFFNNFFVPQYDMSRHVANYGTGVNYENEFNYVSNGNIVTN